MTPGARVAAAIELLAEIEASERPADQVASDYVRQRRFMGAKDRRAVTALAFLAVRARARLGWWLAWAGGASEESAARAAGQGAPARGRVLAALLLGQGRDADAVAGLCDGSGYAPAPLDADEAVLLQALDGQALDDPRQPAWVRLECPAWLLPSFEAAFGADLETELAALRDPAPVDLRLNALLAERRQDAVDALAAEDIAAAPTPLSPLGLRLDGRRAVHATQAFRDGLVELQDEGSQLIALLTGAAPDMAVCDFCAGAGGKTLALAAAMADRGRLVALDVDGARLGRAGPRLQRAGARNVERRLLAGAEDSWGDPWVEEQAGRFDRVLIDAPCSGVGAWRRQPDSRWRLGDQALQARITTQARILGQAARLVKPGGRLVYATCSLLPEENRDRVAGFLATASDFRPLPVERVWAETLGGESPGSGDDLTLTPARHGTDGFYLAVLERAG
jgi:16S rRNA (cytosine967-C5)-methyltransferase